MTDSVNPTNDQFENLVSQYETGVNTREGDAQSWLAARSELEGAWEQLSPEQAERIRQADSTLVQNAGEVASKMAASESGSLSKLRAAQSIPSDQWWWYLDVLSHVSDEYAGGGRKPESSIWSRLLTAVEVGVLIVAVVLLVRNILPQAQTTGSTAVLPTTGPTWTPEPTNTPNPAAFDMNTATVFKAPNDVIEIMLPGLWQSVPSSQEGNYQFSYGQGTNDATNLSVAIGEPKELYEGIMGVSSEVKTPADALNEFKKNAPQLTFGDVRPVKIGKLDGSGVAITIPGDPSMGGGGGNAELWIAPISDKQVAVVIMQGPSSLWPLAQPAMFKMAEGLVINPQNIPTATPTPTEHPLRLTQTAVQQEINALTPSPTNTATPAPAGAATGAATEAANSAATAPATAAQ